MAGEASEANSPMGMRVNNGMAGWCGGVLLMIGLAGCGGYESAYEQAVYDFEPVYCYRTIADPDCYRAADPAADRRVVNYYGPSPRRSKPPQPAAIRLDPPPAEAEAGQEGERPAAEAVGERAHAPLPLLGAAAAGAPRLGGEGPANGR